MSIKLIDNKIFKKSFLFILFIILIVDFSFHSFISAQQASIVNSFSADKTSVGQYEKIEFTFTLTKSYPNPYYFYDSTDTPASDPGRNSPYGVDGVSVDAHFTSPAGKALVVPAFYYQDYTRTKNGATEVMTPSNTFSWKVRFAPEEIGNYTYFLTIADKSGNYRYPLTGSQPFTSVASTSKGFVKVSTQDSRFMEFSNGDSYVPVGSGHQWWDANGGRSYAYEDTFTKYGQDGINLVRIWDQNDGYGLTVEGSYDAYKYPDDFNPDGRIDINAIPKGTQMNQRGNYEEDKIIESAQKNNVYIELSSHGDAYWIWDRSTYNESWNKNVVSWDNKYHEDYWKRNFRYRVARWGYSTSILSWETWNENGHIVPGSPEYNFYSAYSLYQKQTDPYSHLKTTSQGSQSYSPNFWSSNFVDIVNYHDYMMPSRYPAALANDEANFVMRFSWCLSNKGAKYCDGLGLGDGTTWTGTTNKPVIWGEIGVATDWNVATPKATTGPGGVIALHNETWAGLFSPLGTTPLDWFWNLEDSATTTTKYAEKKIVSNFFSNIKYDQANFTYIMTDADKPPTYTGEIITSDNAAARVLGMRSADKKQEYLWIQNRNHTWVNSSSTPAAISPKITVNNLLNESYKVEVWNTNTGSIISTSNMTPANNSLTISVSNLSGDVAVKIESAAATTPSCMCSNNACSNSCTFSNGATNIKCNINDAIFSSAVDDTAKNNWCNRPKKVIGDADGDNVVNSIDYIYYVRVVNGGVVPPSINPDFNGDGFVSVTDRNIIIQNLKT